MTVVRERVNGGLVDAAPATARSATSASGTPVSESAFRPAVTGL
jgi:hypothetical protein